MYFPRTKTCQVQSKDLNLGHFTNASAIYPLSVCCLAFILSVVFTTFSSMDFNYILYWRTLKVSKIYQLSKGLDESSDLLPLSPGIFLYEIDEEQKSQYYPFFLFLPNHTTLEVHWNFQSKTLCGEQAKDSSWSYDSNPIDCLPIITF